MKLTWVKLLLAFVFLSVAAQAQLAAYGKLDLTRFNDNATGSSTWFRGGGVGIYDDFIRLGPVRAGVDLRGNLETGNQFTYRTALVGARLALRAPILPFKPYVQGSVGVGGTRYNGTTAFGINTNYSNKLIWEVLGGVDFTIFPHVDFRALEVGVGKQSSSSGTNYTSGPQLVLISSGLVVRFN